MKCPSGKFSSTRQIVLNSLVSLTRRETRLKDSENFSPSTRSFPNGLKHCFFNSSLTLSNRIFVSKLSGYITRVCTILVISSAKLTKELEEAKEIVTTHKCHFLLFSRFRFAIFLHVIFGLTYS